MKEFDSAPVHPPPPLITSLSPSAYVPNNAKGYLQTADLHRHLHGRSMVDHRMLGPWQIFTTPTNNAGKKKSEKPLANVTFCNQSPRISHDFNSMHTKTNP
jgi:hypothetical protein